MEQAQVETASEVVEEAVKPALSNKKKVGLAVLGAAVIGGVVYGVIRIVKAAKARKAAKSSDNAETK